MMRRFKVTVEYDGTDFAGFQYQAGQRSVQAELERALETLTGQTTRVHGAGRTDAGVHALGQVISFETETRIPIEKLPCALNSALPTDVRAVAAAEAEARFHARFSALSRAYVYVILHRALPSALFGRYTCHYPHPLDLEAMQTGARLLVGTQDFAAWANESREVNSTVREVYRCAVRRRGPFVLVYVEANAFLRGMVRSIAGTLLQVGSGKRAPDEMAEITRSLQRSQAGPSAPAKGLCLVKVRYAEEPRPAARGEIEEPTSTRWETTGFETE
jgi:tRNA pseudouridine38-40 synthase